MSQPTEASQYLLALARRNAQVYAALPNTIAIMLTGSAAQGLSDAYSDIDMITYYDKLPSEEEMLAACLENGGTDRKSFGERTEDEYGEAYTVDGVQCQVAHTTTAAWERDVASVLDGLDVTTPFQKALSGMLDAIPLHGEAWVHQQQAKISVYPEALAEAMVTHYLTFFPMWAVHEHIAARDATVWRYQLLTETAQNLLGVLSGVNHIYYSSFQFKRMHHFVDQMKALPDNFAARLDAMFFADPIEAALQAESLVQDTTALVERHMPQIDTARIRRMLGRRQQPWEIKR